MYTYDQLSSLYDFLLHTGEGNLKKMLVDDNLSEHHLRLLLKIVKTSSEDQFIDYLESFDFPKVKFSPNENKIREVFWQDCLVTFESRGLLSKAAASAPAAA